jgi:nucleoside recognition membrane protein YjiH
MPAAAKFLLPSIAGVLLFLVPFEIDGTKEVALGIIARWIQSAAGDHMRTFCAFVFITSGIVTPLFTWGPESLRRRFPVFAGVFVTGPYSTLMRMVIGTILRRPFRKIFNLPGRSTIDALASWVGASSIAVLVTARQYRGGFYTAREASVIATNFSVVSVPFVFLTAQVAGIAELSGTLYITMVIIGVACALITPRLPPLNRMSDEYYAPIGRQVHEEVRGEMSTWQWARHEALARAAKGPGLLEMLSSGSRIVLDLFFAMMPVAMTIEFIALAVYHHTGILHLITMPLVPLLQLLAIPDAAAAAPGLVVGFLDQFVPALIAASIASPVTSFVLAGLSVTQLIFMAETGILIYRSKIPLPIRYLAAVFAIRTAIALPILVAVAHWSAG